MAELGPSDLAAYTQNRLDVSDPNTANVLTRALSFVRSHCGWPVSPVMTNDVVTLDGPGQWGGWGVGMGSLYGGSYYGGTGTLHRTRVGSSTLFLPTKRLQNIVSIVEDGVTLDLTTLQWSKAGFVVKQNHQPWTSNFAGSSPGGSTGITVTMTHGWSEAEAADWRATVLAVADRMSMVKGLLGPFPTNVGPYHLGAFYGTSRPGDLPSSATWLDDLLAQIDTTRYVIQEV